MEKDPTYQCMTQTARARHHFETTWELNNGEQPQDREGQFNLQQPGGQRAPEAVQRAEDRMQRGQGGGSVQEEKPTGSTPEQTAASLSRRGANLPSPQPLS